MRFEAIVAAVKSQGGFDVDDAMAGGWVNEMHRSAVVASKWKMQQVVLGVTVVGTATYGIPEAVAEIDGLYVTPAVAGGFAPTDRLEDATPALYSRVGTTDLWDLMTGRSVLRGTGGVFAPTFSEAGAKQVQLYPEPDTAGLEIVALAAMIPVDLATGDLPWLPEDMHGDLIDGAISLGMARIDERLDSARVYAEKYAAMVAELARRATRRVGSQPQRMSLYGADFA